VEGNKVKFTIFFRGRELVHSHVGRDILDRLAQDLIDVGVVEQHAMLAGRSFTMVMAPMS
jgi:translation initiation factor IF-3